MKTRDNKRPAETMKASDERPTSPTRSRADPAAEGSAAPGASSGSAPRPAPHADTAGSGGAPDGAAPFASNDPRARARRRLLKLAAFAPPTLLALSSLSGFMYGMAPKPSANPSVVPGPRPQTKPK